MGQQSFTGFAVFVALAFAIMALHGCASSAQRAAATPAAVSEFHDAAIGGDALRSRLATEN